MQKQRNNERAPVRILKPHRRFAFGVRFLPQGLLYVCESQLSDGVAYHGFQLIRGCFAHIGEVDLMVAACLCQVIGVTVGCQKASMAATVSGSLS